MAKCNQLTPLPFKGLTVTAIEKCICDCKYLWNCIVVEFPTTRTELNAVFDIFDRHGTGEINYSEFMEALRPERQVFYYSSISTSCDSVRVQTVATDPSVWCLW